MWYLPTTLGGIEFKTTDHVAATRVEVYVPVYTKRIKPRHVRSFRTITLPLLVSEISHILTWSEATGGVQGDHVILVTANNPAQKEAAGADAARNGAQGGRCPASASRAPTENSSPSGLRRRSKASSSPLCGVAVSRMGAALLTRRGA
jgi:hypothetical protein